MKKKRIILYVVLGLTLICLWEISAQSSNTVRLLLSSPSLVVEYFTSEFHDLLTATWITFYEAFVGLAIAAIFSLGTMVLCLYYRRLMEFILPIMVVSQVIPLITLAPLFIILFGMGLAAKVMMAALLCFFPIFVNFSNGVKLISENIHELTYIYNASKTQKIWHVYFPLATPNIMAGLKISATLAVIGAIVAEFAGAETGLGRNLYVSALRLEPELMMCSLLLCAMVGGIMFGSIHLIEYRIGKWYVKS